jgi:hypothetical protein
LPKARAFTLDGRRAVRDDDKDAVHVAHELEAGRDPLELVLALREGELMGLWISITFDPSH